MLAWDDVEGVKRAGRRKAACWSKPARPTRSTAACRRCRSRTALAIQEVYSDDDNLEAVFKYLVNK